MVWAYTLNVNQIPVYAPTQTGVGVVPTTGSVQPVWDDATMLEVIVRALAIIGVNLQLNTVEQYSMAIKNQGQ